jgi:hypothetical protein
MSRHIFASGVIALAASVAAAQSAPAPKPLEGARVSMSGNTLKVENHSGDPWVEMRIAVTERTAFDETSAYVCWGDRLDADESLSTKLDECTDGHGKRFGALKARIASVSAHVPEHGLERSLFPLK